MERSNTPKQTWFLAQKCVAYIYNITSNPALGYKSPLEVATGETQDISHALIFRFFEPVYYYANEITYPESKEEPGYFVGFAMNTRDALTFRILKTDIRTVITKSVVRSAEDIIRRNRRVNFNKETQKKLNDVDNMVTRHDTRHRSPKPIKEQM